MARPVLTASAPATRTLARACTVGTTPAAVLLPAVAEAARRADAARVGLVDVGCAAGFGLLADRVGVTYDDGGFLGDPASPVQLAASVVGGHRVPTRPVPDLAARVGLDRLGELAATRPPAWVSVEGVGVAPEVPTLGDRPASGHSIVGLALLDGSVPRPEVLGRCWSRGRWLSWSGPG